MLSEMSFVHAALPLFFLGAPGPFSSIFVDGLEAEVLIAAGAVVLDARGDRAEPPYLPNARVIDWTSLRAGVGFTGKLGDVEDVRARLARLGVTRDRPVLVYGAMSGGFGEEGRIFWTLRYLGHAETHILDGGLASWIREGRVVVARPVEPKPAPAEAIGTFEAGALRAALDEVDRARRSGGAHVLDVRSSAEWNGATPYGERRGGHIPGAKHLEWTSLVAPSGRVLSKPAVRKRLRALGIAPEDRVIVYCTGGVRSAFVLAVLLDSGFRDVANYDGSWFEWSAAKRP